MKHQNIGNAAFGHCAQGRHDISGSLMPHDLECGCMLSLEADPVPAERARMAIISDSPEMRLNGLGLSAVHIALYIAMQGAGRG